MFNGHMDTSYSGREPWLAHVPGFQPEPFVREERLYGLGISNMKGALACYVEAVRALRDAGVALKGDLLVAAVCGEIEKAQYGDAQGAEYRGYATGTRHLVTHGGLADMCILGEPTEEKVVLGHFGSLWLRISTQGNFIHTAFSEGKRDQNSILRMREVLDAVLEWIPVLGGRSRELLPRREGDRQRRRAPGRLRLASLAHAAPDRPLPRRARTADEADAGGAAREVLEMVRGLGGRFPDYGIEGEVYVTAPGAEIDGGSSARGGDRREPRRAYSGRRPSATSRAGSRTPPLSPATACRRSTTAPRPGCWTPSTARTSRSRGSSEWRTSTRWRPNGSAGSHEARHLRRRVGGRAPRRPRGRARRAVDARVLRARGGATGHGRARSRSRTCACGRRSCRRSSSTRPATSASTRTSRRTSPGRTRSRRGSCSSRTSTRSSGRTTPSSIRST